MYSSREDREKLTTTIRVPNEMARILKDIAEERLKQDEMWGKYHDRQHDIRSWAHTMFNELLDFYDQGEEVEHPVATFGHRIAAIKIAAVAAAFIETFDATHGDGTGEE